MNKSVLAPEITPVKLNPEEASGGGDGPAESEDLICGLVYLNNIPAPSPFITWKLRGLPGVMSW